MYALWSGDWLHDHSDRILVIAKIRANDEIEMSGHDRKLTRMCSLLPDFPRIHDVSIVTDGRVMRRRVALACRSGQRGTAGYKAWMEA